MSVAELTPAATLEPTVVIPPPRDYSDRVVAVDEFRARESSSVETGSSCLGENPRSSARRASAPWTVSPPVRRLKDEDFDSAILPPPAYEEAADGQRPAGAAGRAAGESCASGPSRLRPSATSTADRAAAACRRKRRPPPLQSVVCRCGRCRRAPTTGKTPAQGTDVAVPAGGARPAPPRAAPAPAASSPKPAPAAVAAHESRFPADGASGRDVERRRKRAVVINGKWSGRTPLTLDDVKFGRYVVRIVQPGYVVMREQFVLSPSAASKNVEATLRRSPERLTWSSAAAAAPADGSTAGETR